MSIRPSSPTPSSGRTPPPPPGTLVLISGLTSARGASFNNRNGFVVSLPSATSRVAVLTVPRGLLHGDPQVSFHPRNLTPVAPAPAPLRLAYMTGVVMEAQKQLKAIEGAPDAMNAPGTHASVTALWTAIVRAVIEAVDGPSASTAARARPQDRSVVTLKTTLARLYSVAEAHVESAAVFRKLFSDGSLGDGSGFIVADVKGQDKRADGQSGFDRHGSNGVQLMRQEFAQELSLAGLHDEALGVVQQMFAVIPFGRSDKHMAMEAAKMLMGCALEDGGQRVADEAMKMLVQSD